MLPVTYSAALGFGSGPPVFRACPPPSAMHRPWPDRRRCGTGLPPPAPCLGELLVRYMEERTRSTHALDARVFPTS